MAKAVRSEAKRVGLANQRYILFMLERVALPKG
jgi:hypothetical protein